MKTKTFKLLAVLGAIAGSVLLPAAEVASLKIEQEGGEKIPQEMLLVTMRLRPGVEFSREHLDNDIKSIYATGKVSDVVAKVDTLADGKVAVNIKVRPSPVIRVLKIEGNVKFDTKDLLEHFTVMEGDRLNSGKLNETLENLRKFYIGKGYSDVRIAPPAIVPDGKYGVAVTVKIQENLRLKVNDVNFENVTVFKERELRNAIFNSYSYWTLVPFINDYLNHGLLNRSELEIDKARLRDMYHNKGYLDFKVREVVLTPCKDDPEFVDILFKIDEGKPYTVDKVSVSGNAAIELKELMPKVVVPAGKTYSRLDEQATVRALANVYDSRGYAEVTVRPVRTIDYPNKKVTLDFKIAEGRKFHVNEIVIIGNTATKHKVLLREMALQPGDPVAKHRIDISRQRLLGMGYFQKVEVEAVNSDDFDAKDIHVKVEEKPDRFNLRIGAGASDINSVFGMAEISTDNFDIANPRNWFYGGGQRLRLQGIYGVDNAGFNLDFIEPWFLDMPVRFELSSYMNQAEYDDWTEERIGVRTSFQRKIFDDFTTVAAGYKFEVVRVTDITSRLKRYFKAKDLDGTFLVSQPSLMIARDTRDSIVDPTEGYNINLFGSITPEFLGSSDSYYRLEARGSYFINFFDKAIVAMVGAKFGVVANFDHDSEVPVFERYFMGGSNSVRGFEYRSIGPTYNNRNIGGQTMLLLTAEVSHPIWGPLRGAAFVDAGNAWKDAYEMSFSGINVGVGYGLRLKLPMIKAPLKLDLAYPIVKNQDNVSRKFRIHFNVGFTF
ncbi:MAG: outer membrane protein assembly factor BamA [Lentisphaeria bacterium]|nr:outer membrane protein assembly factor BamA [Lentisphaeria bacterium]